MYKSVTHFYTIGVDIKFVIYMSFDHAITGAEVIRAVRDKDFAAL
jgi:hypothetical protein